MENTKLIGRTFLFTRERTEPLYKNRIQALLRRKQMKVYDTRKRARLKAARAQGRKDSSLTKDSGCGIK